METVLDELEEVVAVLVELLVEEVVLVEVETVLGELKVVGSKIATDSSRGMNS